MIYKGIRILLLAENFDAKSWLRRPSLGQCTVLQVQNTRMYCTIVYSYSIWNSHLARGPLPNKNLRASQILKHANPWGERRTKKD